MKKFFFGILFLSILALSSIGLDMRNNMIQHTCIDKKEVTAMALSAIVDVQTIVKGCLYYHDENSNTVLDQKIQSALKALDKIVLKVNNFESNDVHIQICLNILPISVAELKVMIREKNMIGNNALISDLVTVITKAFIGISQGVENDLVAYKNDTKSLRLHLSSL